MSLKEAAGASYTDLVQSPSAGSQSDDEMSLNATQMSTSSSAMNDRGTYSRGAPPPVPEHGRHPRTPMSEHARFPGSEALSSGSSVAQDKVTNTGFILPPATAASSQARPPPPPPPGAPPIPRTTQGAHFEQDSREEETEYEGDYDTDMASSATHKDALRAHAREPSFDNSHAKSVSTAEGSSIPVQPPPAHRPVPPPPPGQPPTVTKPTHAPRPALPSFPSSEQGFQRGGDEYDPYKYSAPAANPIPSPRVPPPVPTKQPDEFSEDDEELYSKPIHRKSVERQPSSPSQSVPPQSRPAPPPPPHSQQPPPPPFASHTTGNAPSRQSVDLQRALTTSGRKSMDQPRSSTDQGYIARDVDLGLGSLWWTQPNGAPPVFQNRKDVFIETEESTTAKRGGKTTISKDVYVLFMDYSQTVVTARFDSKEVEDVVLEQRHEAPPQRLRQDQLEEAHAVFGKRIEAAIAQFQNSVVGDGTPQALVSELLRPLPGALLPVGSRAYGALVYANLANATVQQYDEIRGGDIVSFRNARFQGKHGTMHQKYSMDVGKPDHVGIVMDWDGTKKKVRAWEQGRESKKVKLESFKLGDLRSGEVRVWRVMGRGWVGWEGGS